jgi:ketosteroid isomerase-like protein
MPVVDTRTMSGSELDVVRRIYEEFNSTLELPRWALSADVEWYPPGDEPDNGRRSGAEAVAAYVRDWARTFDDYECAVDELIEQGNRVVAPVVLHGRIGSEGQPLSIPLTQVWELRDGKVVCVREYRTRDEALAAMPS